LACIENFLKAKNALDDSYQLEFEFYDVTETECQENIKKYVDDFYKYTIIPLKRPKLNTECYMDEIRKTKTEDVALKNYLYSKSKIRKLRNLISVMTTVNGRLDIVDMICDETYTNVIFNFFYSLHNNKSDWDDSDYQKVFCFRKRIIEMNLIDTNLYNLNLNPRNVDISDFDCDAAIETFNKEAENEIAEKIVGKHRAIDRKAKDCLKTTLKKFDYGFWAFKVSMIGELKVSGTILANEKKNLL
jgi:hypothetical protein